MKKIKLYVPKLDDLWFRKACMEDPATMNYNAGYDLNFAGYHYETGCIDFPKEKWSKWVEDKLDDPNFFYAYILDEEAGIFVGYVNYAKNPETKKASMGIVIKNEYRGQGYMRPALKKLFEVAKKDGVAVLVDTVPKTRTVALKVFYDLGFKVVGRFTSKKFNLDETIVEIEKIL